MADSLDVLTLPEGKEAIRMKATATEHDAVLARHITAVSGILDDEVGPVVQRTVTAETHDGGMPMILLTRRPVASISTVREVTSPGEVSTLAAVTFGVATDGFQAPAWDRDPSLLSGVLRRRVAGVEALWPCGDNTVEVTYVAGRYDTTANVAARYKDVAGAVLRRLWKREAGSWAQSATFYEDNEPTSGSGFFRVAKPIIDEMLADEVQNRSVIA